MPTTTIREKIFLELVSRFEAISKPTYSQNVLDVRRDSWDIAENPARPLVAVVDLAEQVQIDGDIIGMYRCALQFSVIMVIDEVADPGPAQTAMLADIQLAVSGTLFDITDADGDVQTIELSEVTNVTSDGVDNGEVWVEVAYETVYHKSYSDPARQFTNA